jgi:hypothetical protein
MACGGREGWRLLRTYRYDAIVTDIGKLQAAVENAIGRQGLIATSTVPLCTS